MASQNPCRVSSRLVESSLTTQQLLGRADCNWHEQAGLEHLSWVVAAAVAGYFLIPDDSWTQTIYAELVGLLATG